MVNKNSVSNKKTVINTSAKCFIIFSFVSLVACSSIPSTIGPVTIRDSQPLTIDSGTEEDIGTEESSVSTEDIAIAQPVVPDRRLKSIPLIEQLVGQSSQALSDQRYTQAINLAERGLRIDRKEARFYLVLARSYRGLNNNKQSVYFAKQGLRYASKNTSEYSSLIALARL